MSSFIILVIQLCQVHAYVSVFNHDLDILISFLNFRRLFHPETTIEVIFFMNIFSYALYQVGIYINGRLPITTSQYPMFVSLNLN